MSTIRFSREHLVRLTPKVALLFVFACAAFTMTSAQQAKFKSVHPPGSTYTTTISINNSASMAVGAFVDSNSIMNGYAFDGAKYRVIHYPGSINFTIATGVNKLNIVVGIYVGSDTLNHGFLLKGKTFRRYDAEQGLGTELSGINDLGNLIGNVGYNGDVRGFLDIGGTITQFDAASDALATYPQAINNSNQIVGMYIDNAFNAHCFFRDSDGTTKKVDYPGSNTTSCLGINDFGVISGFYQDRVDNAHGFVGTLGDLKTTVLPVAAGINNGGTYVGYYVGQDGVTYGFVRMPGQ
ncbi:MAG TPA: hypothetical protein VH437_13205 [Terriglobales bacterium]